MDDRALVAALVSGDPRGLEGAYRAYADRLYTYCRGMLRDPDAAADAVHDTFLLASQRAGQLREPDRFRSWLYAIARNECLRLLRTRVRSVPLEEAGQVSAPTTEPETGLAASEVRELVWAAAEGLNPGDREVFELSVRHDLAADEVAGMLGVSVAHAHARLSRARSQLERALGALLLARAGPEQCPQLAELLRGWDGQMSILLRKRIGRHTDGCADCADSQRRRLAPSALFSAYSSLPFLAAPVELWPRLELTSGDPGQSGARAEVAARTGRFRGDTGFPRPLDLRRRRRGVAATAVAAVVAGIAVALSTLAWLPVSPVAGPSAPAVDPVLATPTVAASARPAGPTPGPAADQGSPTPAATPGRSFAPPSPQPAPEPPGPPPGRPVPSPPPAPALTVEGSVDSVTCVRQHLRVEASAVANRTIDSAVLTIWYGGDAPIEQQLRVTGGQAAGTVPVPWQESQRFLTWQVTVQDQDGERAQTDQQRAPIPCADAG